MYEYDSGTVLVTFSPPKLYQAKGVDAEVQAADRSETKIYDLVLLGIF